MKSQTKMSKVPAANMVGQVRAAFLFVATALMLLASLAVAVQAGEDPLMKTAICDDTKSRATALKLFDYVDKYFAKLKNLKPLKEQISVEKFYKDSSDAEFHDATFDTFQVNFIREPNGEITLTALSTKSAGFRLPSGLKIGQTMKQVRRILGPPTFINSNSLLYETGGETNSDVLFYFDSNKLVEVRWSFGMAD